ncbi:MAG TPA: hypothetical protein PK812_05265 [Beijerinckiaceae bacterium]|nr:hypothetical protein [Beijerinckiaceae bacterium]
MFPQGVEAANAAGTANGSTGSAQSDAAVQAQFDQSVSTVLASVLSPLVQMVIQNCSE